MGRDAPPVLERVLERTRPAAVELILDSTQGGRTGIERPLKGLVESSTYTLSVTGVPPMLVGACTPISGYSSDSMMTESPS